MTHDEEAIISKIVNKIDTKIWMRLIMFAFIAGGAWVWTSRTVVANSNIIKEREPLIYSIPTIKANIQEIKLSQKEMENKVHEIEIEINAQSEILKRIERKLP